MPVVILKGYIIAPEDDLARIKSELPTHVALTKAEKGCLSFEVIQSKANHCRFDVYEEFVSEHAFQAHQERVKSSKWGEITINVERHYEIIK